MKFTAVALVAAAALALSACSTASTPSAAPTASNENPFTFVYMAGISGAQATQAQQELQGVQVAMDEINAAGGILGRKVVLEKLDSKSDPTVAVSVLQQRLASGTKPDLIHTAIASTEALAVTPVTTRAGIATYAASSSILLDDPKTYPLNKLISAPTPSFVSAFKAYADAEKYKKIELLVTEDASGDSIVQTIADVYEGSNAQIHETRYNAADLDLSSAFQRAAGNDPDVIFSNCQGAPCKRLVSARTSIVGGTDIPMVGDAAMSALAGGLALESTKESLENLKVIIFDVQLKTPAAEQTPEFKAFYKGIAALGSPVVFGSPTSVGYDGLRMFAAAAKKANSIDAKKMVKAIDDIEWKGGDFVSYGNAVLDYTAKSVFPIIPNNAFAVVQVAPLVDSQYEPIDLFRPKR